MSINVTSSGDPTSGRGSTGPDTSRTPLSKPTVIAGAVELADEIGIDPLTIRKLATRLGVKPMAIYHHVANKDEILDGMVDSVFAEIELPPMATTGGRRSACEPGRQGPRSPATPGPPE